MRTGHPELPCDVAEWDATAYGNHRLEVEVQQAAEAVHVRLPWRRHDPDPTAVDTWVVSAAGRRVRNVVRGPVGAEAGELVFEPVDGPGRYHVYYLPFAHLGSAYYPQVRYRTVTPTADPAWQHRTRAGDRDRWAELPQARAVGYQARTVLDSFAPMGFAATAEEYDAVRAAHPDAAFWAFGEDRDHPVGRLTYLPACWAADGPCRPLALSADRGEFRAFQVGVHALAALPDVRAVVHGLPFEVRHLTGGGVNPAGEEFTRTVEVRAGTTQSLWFAIMVPAEAGPGDYRGSVEVSAAGESHRVPLAVQVTATVVTDGGVGEPHRLARLGWLDSRDAHDDEVTDGYRAVIVRGDTASILGRTVRLGPDGLPARITSHFTDTVTAVGAEGRDLLAGAMHFDVGRPLLPGALTVDQPGPARVRWQTAADGDGLRLATSGSLEADGCLEYRLELTARADTTIDDARLTVPLRFDVAKYWMGLGRQGCACPDEVDWSWQVATCNQDAVWIGDVNAGLQLSLRDEHYRRPLNTNYYRERPLLEPVSWGNAGRGGVRLRTTGDRRDLVAFSGPLSMAAGQTLTFCFRLLLTPFKPIDPARHLAERYVHDYEDPATAAAAGGTVVNLHHATPPNPYINDPMRAEQELTAYVADAHRQGLKVKIYDTVRELTRAVPELMALVALGDEVFATGPGGGHAWLAEHLPGDHVPGWAATTVDDVAVVTAGESRWHNIYVRSIEHLAAHAQVDGLYLDDVAFDRTTMKRVRKVLERYRDRPVIDLHSANQFNERDGFSSSTNLYLELFPYLDRLWLGEYVDYEGTDPAYWLVEISGIPFGLMGEMLQDGGNPWRGMTFAMTGRYPAVDNRPLWRAWDELGLPAMTMTGWWSVQAPARTTHPDVLVTTFHGGGRAVLALASWADEPVDVGLDLDWARLGVDPADAVLTAPAIDGFQPAGEYAVTDRVHVEPRRGALLHLHRR